MVTTDIIIPEIKIFLVPANDRISIEATGPGAKITSVEIYNMAGMKVLSINFDELYSIDLDLSDLIQGICIVKINERHSFSIKKS